MLERVKQRSLLPSVDYLIIDEFQDITQLQFDIYEEWKEHMENVLIAGDDDQVVYAWQGADPKLLLGEGGEDVILDTSHRLPPAFSKSSRRKSATSRSDRRRTSNRARKAAPSKRSRTRRCLTSCGTSATPSRSSTVP